MIRASNHLTNNCNTKKSENLCRMTLEWRRVMGFILDDIWENGYEWEDDNGKHRFSVRENKLDFPKYIDYNKFKLEEGHELTARALSSLVTQLAGIIKASTKKQAKRIYTLGETKKEGKNRKQRKALVKAVKTNIPQKPNISNVWIELSSKCAEFKTTEEGKFDGFLKISSFFLDGTKIKIPISFHKHSKSLQERGKMMTSFLIREKSVDIRWKINAPMQKSSGDTIGCDQGLKTVATFSNAMTTPQTDKHGHSVDNITEKMTMAKKGSKRFNRLQKLRTNVVNHMMNQVSFKGIKQVNLEDVKNVGYKNKTSRKLSHWTNTIIRDKIEKKCEEEGVRLIFQSSTYRSQRCSSCGIVRKANRKGKEYDCKHCGLSIDADLNASYNLESSSLPEVPSIFRGKKINLKDGFYWSEYGFFLFSGEEIFVEDNKILVGTSLESVPLAEFKKLKN